MFNDYEVYDLPKKKKPVLAHHLLDTEGVCFSKNIGFK